jgi:hypothetical protein
MHNFSLYFSAHQTNTNKQSDNVKKMFRKFSSQHGLACRNFITFLQNELVILHVSS